MNGHIFVRKLDLPVYAADWHDKPLKWGVYGPSAERQNFSTKAAATLYAKCRRNSSTWQEASFKFGVHK